MYNKKPALTLSINPTYFCNFDCKFCYLSKKQLNDRTILPLDQLRHLILETEKYFRVTNVDIYGGEVGLLSEEYLDGVVSFFNLKQVDINVITNFSVMNPFFKRSDVSITVSWEGDIRRMSETVVKNIKSFDKDVQLIMLASPDLVKMEMPELKRLIGVINSLKNIRSLEIKPYSKSRNNAFDISFIEYENLVKNIMKLERNYIFVNEENLRNVFRGKSHSFSDDHLYITPYGKLAVLDFEDDREYFLEVKTIEDYLTWTEIERKRVFANSFCSSCEYVGRCLSEHLREVKTKDHSCNGFYNLIKWYEKAQVNSAELSQSK
jgi:MoaA/NifB/PqqE/SkfB family radical SAM enzyme